MRLALAFLTPIVVAAGIAALAVSATPARADTAERCGWDGCSQIHCNWTGDRCFRIDEYGRNRGYYGNGPGYDRYLIERDRYDYRGRYYDYDRYDRYDRDYDDDRYRGYRDRYDDDYDY
jgi:hypothetical protein